MSNAEPRFHNYKAPHVCGNLNSISLKLNCLLLCQWNIWFWGLWHSAFTFLFRSTRSHTRYLVFKVRHYDMFCICRWPTCTMSGHGILLEVYYHLSKHNPFCIHIWKKKAKDMRSVCFLKFSFSRKCKTRCCWEEGPHMEDDVL